MDSPNRLRKLGRTFALLLAWLKSKTQATGAYIGIHVRIGQNVTLTLDSAWK